MDITGLGSIADLAKGVLDKIWPPDADPTEKLKAQMALQKVIEARESSILDAQKSIIVAEMQQGDKFTKRARPTVVYAGLAFIFLNNVVPKIALYVAALSGKVIPTMPQMELPTEFWWAWTSICSVWAVGRTMEKRGAEGKILSLITGK